MIFVDSNVFMYAVGRPHALRSPAVKFFDDALRKSKPLATSAEVLQELSHVYLRAGRTDTLDDALTLIARAGVEVWPLEEADVTLARQLHDRYPALEARDLCHLASCRRRGVKEIMTFDQSLADASPMTNPNP